jgi:hypothetical protein
MTSTARLLALLIALAVPAAACADDDEIPTTGTAGPEPGEVGTELTVVVDGGEFDQLTYTVNCDVEGGTVVPHVDGVDPAEACQRLADPAVAELLVQGPPADQICTEVYGGPQVATITGWLDGEPVEAEVSRVNGCEIDTWDRLLAGFLPPTEWVGAEG